jgi:hydroxymethylpyrimidine/phosphomethylpyrimidine kinase
VAAQVDAVMDDIEVAVTKTGMLSTSDIIETVVEKVREHDLRPLIVDPVMMSKSGYKLLQDEAIDTLREALIPEATLVTPNAHEAAFLTDMTIENLDDAREAARQIYARGPDAVIVKGGHLREGPEAVDVYFDGETELTFSAERIDTENTHGTGCTYASSIAAQLARGRDLPEAIDRAKRYVTEAIRHALPIGEGHGPTNHFYHLDPEAALSQIASTQEGAGAAPQSA